MEQAVSLKQVLAQLRRAAQQLHAVFHSALRLWLQYPATPQQQKQNVYAEAAVQAVQAALHAASMCATDDLKLAWMKLHVPSVSEAVSAYVVAQSEVSLRRAGIHQQLMTGQTGAPNEKLSAALDAELESYWQLHAASRIAAFLAPLSTLVKAISEDWNVDSSSSASQHQQEQRKNSYRQRDQLLAHMAAELGSVRACMVKPFQDLELLLKDLGLDLDMPVDPLMPDACKCELDALWLQLQASTAWFRLALTLPHTDKHEAPEACLRVVDWDAHLFLTLHTLCPEQPIACCGELLCQVLARPYLHRCLEQHSRLPHVSYLLYAYDVQPQQMRQAGVSEAVVQQLSHISQASCQIMFEAKDRWIKEMRLGGSCKGNTAVDIETNTQAETLGHDGNLDEMQVLVQMMYGSLDVKL